MSQFFENIINKYNTANPSIDFGNGAVGAATLLLAFVTLYIAFGSDRRERGRIIADFRQKWIDDLREILAEHTKISYDISHIVLESDHEEKNNEKLQLYSNLFKIESYCRLKLNPNEKDHRDLLDKMIYIRRITVLMSLNLKNGVKNKKCIEDMQAKRSELANISSKILKDEWDRLVNEVYGFSVWRAWRIIRRAFFGNKLKTWAPPPMFSNETVKQLEEKGN